MVNADTDNFVLHIRTADIYIYQYLKETNDEIDLSGYDSKNINAMMQEIRKVLGRFKDEVDGKIMTGF